jgi:cephalosporin-C deacetylase-like acetyl esterase
MNRVLAAVAAIVLWSVWSMGAPPQGRGQNPAARQDQEAREKLIAYINGLAGTDLAARKQAIRQIQTQAEAERRKAEVRAKILGLIGGLPERRGPVAVKQFGTITGDGFRVEKIAYESLPSFWVTADVYLPASGSGPFPAVVIAPGHGAAGKLEDWSWGANLARNGIASLAYDPFGQGERLQYYDPELKASKIGGPTAEHGEANVGPMLIGDDVARYWVNDAMRAVDYLTGRKDIDGSRIGAFGCSGGGTATAYFAALDDRVKAAASACYITSFQELLASPTGVQDAEQTIPHFIEQGMDFPDWVEQMAPKPYAVISTTADMFPFEGARQSYEEVKRFYGLYGAADRVQWITGPGGHGNLGPIAPQIVGFFTKYLKGSAEPPSFTPMRLERREDLQCTPTGQVSTSLGGETVYSLNRKRAEPLMAPERVLTTQADVERLQSRLRLEIHALTGETTQPGAEPPTVDVKATEQRDGYKLETISVHSDDGTDAPGMLAVPDGAGTRPAVLMMEAPGMGFTAAGGDLDRLAKAGRIVMVVEPRPTPAGTESIKSPLLGSFNLLSLRAFLVGKTIIGLRMDDAIRAVNWLCARPDVDRAAISAYGNGPLGLTLLHAAALDTRIGRVLTENALTSYRMIVEEPIHRNVSEVVIPGVLRKYDTGDLLLALYPRPVTIINPEDAVGAPVTEAEFRKALAYVWQSDEKLGQPDRIRLAWRGPREPLPVAP